MFHVLAIIETVETSRVFLWKCPQYVTANTHTPYYSMEKD